MNIIIIGPRSVGKTIIAERIARRLDIKFFELDDLVSREIGDIDEYVNIHSPQEYRINERRVLINLIKKLPEKFILSIGAGTIASQLKNTSKKNAQDIKKLGKIFYLCPFESDEESITALIQREAKRKGKQTKEQITDLYPIRKKAYEELYDFKIICEHKKPVQIISQILAMR